MAACSQSVFPPAVIDSVTNQMDAFESSSQAVAAYSIPESMKVQPCLAKAQLSDALVRTILHRNLRSTIACVCI